jgi:hypothetical protein
MGLVRAQLSEWWTEAAFGQRNYRECNHCCWQHRPRDRQETIWEPLKPSRQWRKNIYGYDQTLRNDSRIKMNLDQNIHNHNGDIGISDVSET